MANSLIISPQNTLTIAENIDFGELIKPLKKELLLMKTFIAGTSYIDESVIENLHPGDRLLLKREPQNKFDDMAIVVLDNQNRKIGYIPEKDNEVFARLMDGGKIIFAKVEEKKKKDYRIQISIGVYLEDF